MSEISSREVWDLAAVGIMLFGGMVELALNALMSNVLNGHRDQIMMGINKQGLPLSVEHRWQVFYADWIPLGAITTVVVAFVGLAFYRIGYIAGPGGVRWLGYFGAALNAWVFVAYLVMLVTDSLMVVSKLRDVGRTKTPP